MVHRHGSSPTRFRSWWPQCRSWHWRLWEWSHLGAAPARSSASPSFLALTILAELKPVPSTRRGNRLVSLAFIFIVSSQIIFGWEYGVLVGAAGLVVAQVVNPTLLLRASFNTAVYIVAAFAASLPWFIAVGSADPVRDGNFGLLTGMSFAEGGIFVGVNVALVCFAIALFEGVPPRGVLADHLRHSGPAFGIMGFIAALTVALWTVWPPLVVLLAGPLFALALFQRYALRTRWRSGRRRRTA